MDDNIYRPGGKKYIYVNDEKLLKVDAAYIEGLKKIAKENNYNRFTMCLHNDVREHVHEMIHIYRKYEYVRPHFHPQKTETKIILEGKFLVIIYDANGCVTDKFVMSKCKNNIFTFRMDRGIIHTNIPLTDVVFQEIITGPYVGKDDSVFPMWAHETMDKEAVKKWIEKLLNTTCLV